MWVFSVLECLCKTSDLREGLPLRLSYALSHEEQHRLLNFHLYCRLLLDTFNLILPAEGIICPGGSSWLVFLTHCPWFPGLEIFTLPLPPTHLSREPSPSCSLVTFTVFRSFITSCRHSEVSLKYLCSVFVFLTSYISSIASYIIFR